MAFGKTWLKCECLEGRDTPSATALAGVVHTVPKAAAASISSVKTTTALAVTDATPNLGQSITFTAWVHRGGNSTAMPTGRVTFKDGATVLGSANLASGKTTFSTSALTAGTHEITAVYAGASGLGGSTSSGLRLTVARPATVNASSFTRLSINDTTLTPGQSMTLTATVTRTGSTTAPTGSVTFKDGSTTLATVALSGGKASYSTSSLAAGSHLIAAVYNGASGVNGGASSSQSVSVTRAGSKGAATVALTGPSSMPSNGAPLLLSASVRRSDTGAVGTGTVTFKDGSATVATIPLFGGQAYLAIYNPSSGAHAYTISYGGDASTNSGGSNTLTYRSSRPAPQVSLGVVGSPLSVGKPLTLTATVRGGAGTPTGRVVFRDGNTVLGNPPVDENGSATMKANSGLSRGRHTITATYEGDDWYGAASASTVVTIS